MNNTQPTDQTLHKLFVGLQEECEQRWIDYCESGRRDRLTILVHSPDGCWLWVDSANRRQPR